jgi:hypothetical protein
MVIGASATLATGGAAAFFLASRGLMALDLGVGRSVHPLGPVTLRIRAPRDLVFEIVAAPYLGKMPGSMEGKIEILERHGDMVVALHRTPLPLRDAITVESVAFERPERVTFRLLRGPVPHVSEEFLLEERDGETEFIYTGELGADLWALGRLYGGRIVKPVWEKVVRDSLAEVKAAAEERAAARARRARRGTKGREGS